MIILNTIQVIIITKRLITILVIISIDYLVEIKLVPFNI